MTDKEKYGNKGKNLLLMKTLGLPVPPFVVLESTTQPTKEDISAALFTLNAEWVSVRSSPNYSLPGILDTTLNVKGDNVDLIHLIAHDIMMSVNSDRVQTYKKNEGINDAITSGVIIQKMVFGNLNNNSGTGVVFSSNPITGEDELYGEFLVQSQGMDLVDGSTTPENITNLKLQFPKIYEELYNIAKSLEIKIGVIQDIEFTFEDGKLYILQTRDAKILHKANTEFQMRLLTENKITIEQWSKNVSGVKQNIQRSYDIEKYYTVAQGIGASSGLLEGKVILNKEGLKLEGEKIFVANLTSTDDIDIISGVQGILTINGGKTSHAAIVSRSWGKVCVVGCGDVEINGTRIKIGDKEISEGESILIDGDTGKIYLPYYFEEHGQKQTTEEEVSGK
jgi:pyruvate,orthophosphate dikinase